MFTNEMNERARRHRREGDGDATRVGAGGWIVKVGCSRGSVGRDLRGFNSIIRVTTAFLSKP